MARAKTLPLKGREKGWLQLFGEKCIIIIETEIGRATDIMGNIKRYACFTDEQQQFYEGLNPQHRLYVDYRGKGYNKAQAYRACGYSATDASRAATMIEKRNKGIVELISILNRANTAQQLTQADSNLNQRLDAIAQQTADNRILEAVENCDGENARRITFYRDIVNGKIKTVKVRKRFDGDGNLLEKNVEEIADIDGRMRARRELDKLLGLNEVLDIGSVQCGNITVNIVDATKKEELADDRNRIELDPDSVEIIDGEKCVVVDESVEK